MKNFYPTYQPYFKKILQLSYPIIVGQLGIVLMGVADVVMIGRLESVNLAAASLANSLYFLICILGIGTLTAVSPLVAKSSAEGHNNSCAILFRQSIWAAVMLSLLIGAIVFVLTENLDWFGQTARVNLLTRKYLHVLNLGTLPLMFFIAVKQFSDGLGHTKPAAVITIIALLMNILGNWILIYGHWGFPRLELIGTGIATDMARLFMGISMYLYVRFSHQYKHYHKLKEHDHDLQWLKEIFRVGLPSGFQYFFEIGAFAFAAIMIGWISEFAMAAHQIAINVASVTYMVATGISAGGSIAVGDALGRKNRTDIVRSGNAALIMGAAFMGFCALILGIFDREIVFLYIADPVVGEMAGYLLLVAALFQLSDGIQCVSLGILRGIGDTKIPTAITIVAYWVIGIPIGYYLGFKTNLSLYGIWIALLFGLTFSAVMLSVRFRKESRSIDLNNTTAIGFH